MKNSNNQKNELHFPSSYRGTALPTQGKYPNNYPEGAIIHYSANNSVVNTLNHGVSRGYCYFVIGKEGDVYQPFPIDEWGYHAGKSVCPVTKRDYVHRFYVGIEVICNGELQRGPKPGEHVTWYRSKVNPKNIREIYQPNGNHKPGFFERFTDEQEKSLLELLTWLHCKNPEVFKLDQVFGHDEVSPGRKVDPGGSLSLPMPEYRKFLAQEIEFYKSKIKD